MIRDAVISDLADISELLLASFEPQLRQYMAYTQHGIARHLEVAIRYPSATPGRRLLVADGDGAGPILAFADFQIRSGPSAFLSYMCVNSNSRGNGLAAALIDEFLRQNRSLQDLSLDVFEDNDPALRVYSKFGFRVHGNSVWVSRPVTEQLVPVEIQSLAVSLAAHEAYGFCEFRVGSSESTERVGLLGASVVRCYSIDSFEDGALLAGLRTHFPMIHTAFAILGEQDLDALRIAHSVVKRTNRMTLVLDGGGRQRDGAAK